MRITIICAAVAALGLVNVGGAEITGGLQVYDTHNSAQYDAASMGSSYDVATSGIASDNDLLIGDILARLLPPDASENIRFQFEVNLRLADTATLEEISWASTFEEAESILLFGSADQAALAGNEAPGPKAIGSTTQDYVYTAVSPCRITDSRPTSGGPQAPGTQPGGTTRNFFVYGNDLAFQGGNPNGCISPRGEPRGVHINVTVIGKAPGHLTIFPSNLQQVPTASFINYGNGTVVANAGNIQTAFNLSTEEISVFANGDAEVIIDVLGYFHEVDAIASALAPALADQLEDPLGDRLFGGSGGDSNLTVSSNVSWLGNLDAASRQYNNCNITGTGVLSVPAGTTIRCAGDVTIDGIINVSPGTVAIGNLVLGLESVTSVAHPGDTRLSASRGQLAWMSQAAVQVNGGFGGSAIPHSRVGSSWGQLKIGGGAGAGVAAGGGGGLIKIYANGTITLNGTINANGSNATQPGGGGGGGGIVILASREAVNVSSVVGLRVSVQGGSANNSSSPNTGNGGGGGGGIVILAAPVVNALLSKFNFAGGAGATSTTVRTSSLHQAGHGGGGSGGKGGSGGALTAPGNTTAGQNGDTGQVWFITKDPLIYAIQ